MSNVKEAGQPTPIKLKHMRLIYQLTQAEAAELIAVSKRSWVSWEGGTRNMPVQKWALFLLSLPKAK